MNNDNVTFVWAKILDLKTALMDLQPNYADQINNDIKTFRTTNNINLQLVDNCLLGSLIQISRTTKIHCKNLTSAFIQERENPDFRHRIKKNLELDKNTLNNNVKSTMKWFPTLKETITEFINWTFTTNREINESLLERSLRPTSVNLDESSIINLTEYWLPYDIKLVLSFGPKFCFPPTTSVISTAHFLTHTLTSLIDFFPVETHFEIYKQISIAMNNERKKNALYRHIWLDFLHYRINKFIKANKDLLITRSDKGKHTVLIRKEEYIEKVNNLVLSTSDYIRIDEVNLEILENKNNKFVEQLDNLKVFSKVKPCLVARQFVETCTFPARMYGLIKIHKENSPARPITSACSAVGFKLAELFTEILNQTFPENGFHIKSSIDLKEQIEDMQIDEDDIMLSFDVTSMFTNITIDMMLEIIKERAQFITENFNIPFFLFEEIFTFILRDCAIFKWQDNWYKQKDSLAMGSPLSPILAKILMNKIISTSMKKLISPPKILALYVDDSFWVVKKAHEAHILNVLNDFNTRIKFTSEKEVNNKINFLDISIIRTAENTLITNWYKKPFASYRLLNFYSHHEPSCITQTAIAFVKMILNLSHPSFFEQNKSLAMKFLRLNSFPETEIIGIIQNNYTFMKPQIPSKKFQGQYIPIKYRSNLTKNLKKQLGPFLTNERLVGIPDRINTKIYSPIKDALEINDRINTVLMLYCNCNKHIKMSYTKYLKRCEESINEISKGINISEGTCTNTNHLFNKLKVLQCKNFTYTRTLFDMLAYAYKDKLIQTNFSPPIFRLGKHLIYAKDQEKEILFNIN